MPFGGPDMPKEVPLGGVAYCMLWRDLNSDKFSALPLPEVWETVAEASEQGMQAYCSSLKQLLASPFKSPKGTKCFTDHADRTFPFLMERNVLLLGSRE